MDNFFKQLRPIIQQHQTALSQRNRISSILKDSFPQNAKQTKLLMMGYDEGVVRVARHVPTLSLSMLEQYRDNLQENNGISKGDADWIVATWFLALGKKITDEARDYLKGNVRASGQRNTSQKTKKMETSRDEKCSTVQYNSVASGIQEIIKTCQAIGTNHPVKTKTAIPSESNGIRKIMNLLQRLFRETFNATNPPKWAYGFEHEIVIDNPRPYFTGVPMSNEERLLFPGSFEVIHTSIANQRFFDETKEMSNDEELRTLCLKLICHGQYHQDDIIHLRVDEGLTGGWALTYDSICAGGVFGNFRKAYRNIGDVDDCIASLVFSNRACFSVSDLQPIIMSNPSIASLKNFLIGAQKLCSYDDYS